MKVLLYLEKLQYCLTMQEMWETWVPSLDREDPLEECMTTHSSVLAWRIAWTEEPGGLQSWGHKESDTTEWIHTRHTTIKKYRVSWFEFFKHSISKTEKYDWNVSFLKATNEIVNYDRFEGTRMFFLIQALALHGPKTFPAWGKKKKHLPLHFLVAVCSWDKTSPTLSTKRGLTLLSVEVTGVFWQTADSQGRPERDQATSSFLCSAQCWIRLISRWFHITEA